MSKNKSNREKEILLKEYDTGQKLRTDYFNRIWAVASIILPICFGLIGLSYTKEVFNLE